MSDTPALTEVQRLQFQVAWLRAKLAEATFNALVRDFDVPGYGLTADGDYVKQPDAAP